MNKTRVGVIFGGKSAEHEVSLRSAKNIIDSLDKQKYEPLLIGIAKTGEWFLCDSVESAGGGDDRKIALVPQGRGAIANLKSGGIAATVDVVFPVLHGPFGEDGTVQGLLKIADVPFVGPSVVGSAVGMDKDVMKRLLRDAGIPTADFLVATEHDIPSYDQIVKKLGLPFFVKPANMGSSVGINRVKNENDFGKALEDAFSYDRKVIIEENLAGQEIECSVMGNDKPLASALGEVIANHEFYSYEAKYIDQEGATLKIPAELPPKVAKKVQDTAIKTFKVLDCEGMARVDFFVKKDGEVLVGEINTIPGFTSISMYPKLWQESGIAYPVLIDRLISLAIERYNKEQKLKTSYAT